MAKTKTKTKKKKALTPAQEIARRTQKFKAATPAQKRVMIAADVIAQIKARRFRPSSQIWLQPVEKDGVDLFVGDIAAPSAPVRELFFENTIPACECCALGAMFMSCTLYNNKTSVRTFDKEMNDFTRITMSGRFSNGLNSFFSRSQLRLIEIAFEGGSGGFTSSNEAEHLAAEDWFYRLSDDKKRLVAIMENIIENKGTFKP